MTYQQEITTLQDMKHIFVFVFFFYLVLDLFHHHSMYFCLGSSIPPLHCGSITHNKLNVHNIHLVYLFSLFSCENATN